MGQLIGRSGAATDAVVFDAIRRVHETTRADLARELGVTPATVTTSVKRLLAEGLVVEAGRAPSRGGKPASLLRVHEEGRWAIGCAIEGDRLGIVAMGMDGRLLRRIVVPWPPPAADADRGQALLADAVGRLGAADPVRRRSLIGLGVVDLADDAAEAQRLAASLGVATGLPVTEGSGGLCAALGSHWMREQPHGEPVLTVHLGSRISLTVLQDGRPLLPAPGRAAQLDHVRTQSGPLLGDVASPRSDVERALAAGLGPELGLEQGRPPLVAAHSRLTEAAAHGHVGALEMIEASSALIARAVAELASTLSIRRVVLSGTSVAIAPTLYRDAMRRALDEQSHAAPTPCSGSNAEESGAVREGRDADGGTASAPEDQRVVISRVWPHPCAIGAAALALRTGLSPHGAL